MKLLRLLTALLLCSCSSEEVIDRINGLPSDDKINSQYEHVSASAPEALKPYYDAGLTQALNR